MRRHSVARAGHPAYTPYRSPEVFAVEDTSVQLHWRGLPPGEVEVHVVERRDPGVVVARALASAGGPGGAGAATVDGLQPATEHQAVVTPVRGPSATVAFTTLAPPPGPLLTRVATMSDLHLGTTGFGLFPRARDPETPAAATPGFAPHTLRAAHAGARALREWGAELVVLKGDLTDNGRVDEWRAVGELVEATGLPTLLMLGNHERMRRPGRVDPAVGLAEIGRRTDRVLVHDVPGARLVLADTTSDHGWGTLRRVHDEVVDAVREAAPGPAIVLLHHYLEPFAVPTFWPPGVPAWQARRFTAALAAANPATLLTSGHSHRHRRHDMHGLAVVEVGAPKDYPGVWAGYAIHEGGVRQVVRRIATPECLAWTDRTRGAMAGLWGHWTPGRLGDRCFTIAWPR